MRIGQACETGVVRPRFRASINVPAALLVVGLVALAACAPAPAGSAALTGAPAAASGSVTATGAWARPAERGGVSAVYLELHNPGPADAALTGASTAAAASTTVHETSTDASGMTGMHHAPSVTIPAGGDLNLEPGGYHVMLEGLADDLDAGSTVEITLAFDGGATLDVTAEVRADVAP